MLADTKVDVAIVAANDIALARTGTPFDLCNALVLASSALQGLGAGQPSFETLARSLLPMVRTRVVVNAEDEACLAMAKLLPAQRTVLYASRPDVPALQAHLASGGGAAWVTGAITGPTLVIASSPSARVSIVLDGKADAGGPIDCGAADIALAASLAGALGCTEQHLRQGLAGVRLAG